MDHRALAGNESHQNDGMWGAFAIDPKGDPVAPTAAGSGRIAHAFPKCDEMAGHAAPLENRELSRHDARLEKGGGGMASASALDQALARYIAESGRESVPLSQVAAHEHLSALASMRSVELGKPYFTERPHLYICTEDDQLNPLVSLTTADCGDWRVPTDRASCAQPSVGSNGAAAAVAASHKEGDTASAPQTGNATPSSSSSSQSGGPELTGRQRALRDLEEQIVMFIAENTPVVLCRFAANPALKKLARTAGVELKKGFFSDRTHLFKIQEETSGNVRVCLSGAENSDLPSPQASPKSNSTQAVIHSEDSGSTPGPPSSVSPPVERQSSTKTLSMIDIGLLFLHRQTKGTLNPVAMNLFGLDTTMSQVAAAEGTAWRRAFFVANHEFFLYKNPGSTASISPTKVGQDLLTHLLKTNRNAQEFITAAHSPVPPAMSKAELLEQRVVEFLKAQPDQEAFLHSVAVDPQLRKLSIAADVPLRKPFYESRPKLFQMEYLGSSTVMVWLKSPAAKASPPPVRRLTANKEEEIDQLWTQLQNEIDTFFLDGGQRQYLLANVGNQPAIKRIAAQLEIRVGKEFFSDRHRQYVLVDSDRAKAMTVGFTPPYYHSLRKAALGNGDGTGSRASSRSSGSARSGLAYAPDPTMRRMETIAVESMLRAGSSAIPLPQLVRDPEIQASRSKVTATFGEAFFRRRPHLFHCTTLPSGILCIDLPQETNRFNPLEQACVTALQKCPGYRSELGSLICSHSLERLVGGYTSADVRIAKAFFMSRPAMFTVLQKGSRAEIVLNAKHRTRHAATTATATKPPTRNGSEEPSATVEASNQEETIDFDEMATWEEELAGAEFFEADEYCDDDDEGEGEDEETTGSKIPAASGNLAQPIPNVGFTPPSSSTTAQPNHHHQQQQQQQHPLPQQLQPPPPPPAQQQQQQQRPVSPREVLKDFQRFSEEHSAPRPYTLPPVVSQQPWPAHAPGSMAPLTHAPASMAPLPGPQFMGGGAPYSFINNPESFLSGNFSNRQHGGGLADAPALLPNLPLPPGSRSQVALAPPPNAPVVTSTNAAMVMSHTAPATAAPANSTTSAVPSSSSSLAEMMTEERLDEAEALLLRLGVHSLAYALRRKRSGGVSELTAESLQLNRLRSELLQLQLRVRKTALCIEEEFCGESGAHTEVYCIRVMIKGRCYGESRGVYKVARVEAMIDAAAQLVLECP